jgi:hypothetical protein
MAMISCPYLLGPGRQAIRSDCLVTIRIPHHIPQGEGLPQKGEGFSGLNVKTDTNGQRY